jgi:glutathione peroxidase-family protein
LPEWNFGKYVIGKNGKVVAFFPERGHTGSRPSSAPQLQKR